MRFIFFIILLLCSRGVGAQNLPLQSWASLFTYNSASAVAIGNNCIYGGKHGLLKWDKSNNSYTQYTKVNGLSEASITNLAYDNQNKAVIISYDNSNIDILENEIVYNIPDLKLANIIASKKVNTIQTYNGEAYIATGLGIVVINIAKKEVKSTYPMLVGGKQSEVLDIQFKNDSIFCLTNLGILKADANNALLQNINNWQLLTPNKYEHLVIAKDSLFVSNDTNLYYWNGATATTKIFGTTYPIVDIVYAQNKLWVSGFKGSGAVYIVNHTGTLLETVNGMSAVDAKVDEQDKVWVGNLYNGLCRLDGVGMLQPYVIDGPNSQDAFNLRWFNNKLFVCGGSVDNTYTYQYNRSGLGVYSPATDSWEKYNQFETYPQMDTLLDVVDALYDRSNGNIYFTSYGGGLVEVKKDKTLAVYKQNSPIESLGGKNFAWLSTNLAQDKDNIIWLTVGGANNNLLAKMPNGSWKTFALPLAGDFKAIAQIEIDNANQKWMVLPLSKGLCVFNDNGTLDNKNDDQFYNYTFNNGNLASNQVNCIAKDRDGKIWVGTNDGISIINCPESVFSAGGCPAENKIVQYDLAAGKLFQDQDITALAVDGANRKWVGTSNGLWLISDDAEKIIYAFNDKNSPLPSNEIKSIVIDPITGNVYIATLTGIVMFKSTAIGGVAIEDDLKIFPNPITKEFKNLIAISGVIEDAEVFITDAAGQLIYKTKALGGQAVWNGLTYTGDRPQTGVYYVYANKSDGSTTQKGKFIFYH